MSTGNKQNTYRTECLIHVKSSHNPRPPTFYLSDRPEKRLNLSLGLDAVIIPTTRGLKDTQHGIIFQLNLLALVLYRAYHCSYEEFGLATEVAAAGKFDDVVFLFKRDGKKYMRLIQAKHFESNRHSIKLNDLKSKSSNNPFGLLKYFKSYLEIRKLYDDIYSDLYNYEIEYTAIVTNKTLTTEVLQHFQDQEISNQNDDDLLTKNGQPRKYSIKNGSLYEDLSAIFKENEPDVSQMIINEFFEKFRLVTNYPDRLEIEQILEEELRTYYQILDSSAKLYILRTEMYDWLAEKTGRFYTKKLAGELFERIERKVLCYEMYGLSKSNLMSIPNEYTFQNDQLLEWLKKFLDSESVFIIAIKFETMALGRIRTVQTFKKLTSDEQLSEEFKSYTHKFGHLFINSNQFRDRDFLSDLKERLQDKNMWNLIVIELDDTAEDKIDAIISKLIDPQRKVILISTNNKENILLSKVQKTDQIDTNFSDLEPNSQDRLLKTENVRFQNTTMHIDTVIRNQDKNIIDAIALDGFLRNEDSPRIGISFPLKTYVEKFYIKRRFRLMIWIQSTLKDKLQVSFTENILYYTYGSNLKLSSVNDIIVVSPLLEDFKNTVESNKSKNIHWLEEADNKLIWKQSKGSVSVLIPYRENDVIEEDECLQIEEEALVGKREKVVIISGEYGVGKSTVFGSIAKKIKEMHDLCWTIRIDLLDYSSFLTEKTEQQPIHPASMNENENSCIKLLIELLQSREDESLSTFEERLLRASIQKPEDNSDSAERLKIALFIDQFSEINFHFQKFVLNMLVGLKSTEVYQIFVSTRPATRSVLEVALGSFAYEIEPFSKADRLALFKARSLDEEALNMVKSWNGPCTPLYLEILSKIDTKLLKALDTNCIFDIFAMTQPSQDDTQDLYQQIFQNYFLDSNSTGQNFDLIKFRSDLSPVLTADSNMSVELQRSYANYSIVKFLGDCLLHRKLNQIFYDILIMEFLQKSEHSFIRILLDSWWKKYGGQICNESAKRLSVHFSSVHDELRQKVLSSILREGCWKIFQVLLKGIPPLQFPTSELTVDFVKMLVGINPNSAANALFLIGAKRGNVNICEWLLNSKTVDINFKLNAGRTLADDAVKTSDIAILKLLETNGVTVRIEDSDRLYEIYANICKFNNRENFKWLLSRGLTIDSVLKDGSSLLHIAARSASTSFFSWLLYENNGKKLVSVQNEHGHTPLHVAIASNNLPAVKVLIENGANVKLTDKMGLTMLHYAAMHGNEVICLQLLHHYEDVNLKTNEGKTPLLVACQANNLAAVKTLIENGGDINSVDNNGYTILHFAALFGDREMLLAILNYFHDINSKTKQNETPLHMACKNGNLEAIKVLINNNADVNLRDSDGYSILDIAILTENIQISSYLLQYLNINSRNSDGNTPLLFAALMNKFKSLQFLIVNGADMKARNNDGSTILHITAKYGDRDSCSFVLYNYKDVDIKQTDGATPLHVAVSNGNFDTIKVLIKNKANVNLTDKKGWSVWHYAACTGSTEICSYLLNYTSDINAESNDGNTPVLVAATQSNFESVRYLIEKGADVKKANKEGLTLLHKIAQHGNKDICFYVLDNCRVDINAKTKEGVTALHFSICHNNFEIVKALIRFHADIALKNQRDWTVWHYAAQSGDTDICSYLLKHNNDINFRTKQGYTPLIVAAKNNKFEIVKYLIENGADVSAGDNRGFTILHIIAEHGNRDICSYVLDKCKEINVEGMDGATPLHVAVAKSNFEAVKVFIENKANTNLKNKKGCTIWHYAARAGNIEICSYLLNYNNEINIKGNKQGSTPLLLAATKNQYESLKFLIENNADVKTVDHEGWTILHAIAQHGNRVTCSYLLDKYNDINVRRKDGATPLHVAVSNSNFETVKVLIEHNADLHVTTEHGITIWHNAVQDRNKEICLYLLDSLADSSMKKRYTEFALNLTKEQGAIKPILEDRLANLR